MRLPRAAHTSRPWRIHELTRDFTLEDVWELPITGGPDDFPLVVRRFGDGDPAKMLSGPARLLWEIRWKLGALLRWDRAQDGIDARVPSLRERLPVDLRDGPAGPEFVNLPFRPLYLCADEWAAEMANRTVHGVMHLGWVPDGTGGWHAQMAVLVRPNGWFGRAYMAAIKPFRYLVVYPALMRHWDRASKRAVA